MKQRTATLAVLLLLASSVFVFPRLADAGARPAPEPQRTTQRRRQPARRPAAQRRPRVDYSNFNHNTRQHREKACSSCHTIPTGNWNSPRVRDARSKALADVASAREAFPDVTDYPDHPSCVNCHRNEFFRGARPVICTICHVNVSPRDDRTHAFQNPSVGFVKKSSEPRPGGSQFHINFPHDKHQDVMARLTPPREGRADFGFVRASFARQQQPAPRNDSCTPCHQTYVPQGDSPQPYAVPTPSPFPEPNALKIPVFFLKKGTFMTTPTGHASCFNCHYQDGGEKPLANDCKGCHTLRTPAAAPAPTPSDIPDAKTAAALGATDKYIVEKWLRREAATFRHEWADHANIGCMACHLNITSISTLDQKTFKVPITTCASSKCHGTPKVGGKNQIFLEVRERSKPEGKDYACIKCHVNNAKKPTPDTHKAMYPTIK